MVASNAFDYYYQTLENVRFFSPQHADVTIVTAKEPLGTFKALVMRAEGKTRTALLSVTANSMPDALRLLHHKSAEAVHNHMTMYGCDFVREVKKHSKKKQEDDSSDTDIVDDTSSDSSEGSMVSGFTFSKAPGDDDDDQHSDSSDDERASRKHHRRSGRTKARGTRRTEAFVRSRSSSPDLVDSSVIDTGAPPADPPFDPVPNVVPAKPLAAAPIGRIPPPGWSPPGFRTIQTPGATNMPTPPSSDVSPFSKFCPPHPSPPSWMPRRCPPAMSPPAPEQIAPPSRDVKLHLVWPSYGEVRVIEHCKPSRRILEAVAARCATEQKASFGLDASFFASASIKATLRHVQLGNDRYSLSSFRGEDLTSLFDSAGGEKGAGIPLFEIEIERVPPVPIGRPWIMPRPMGGNIEIVEVEPPSKGKGKRGEKAHD